MTKKQDQRESDRPPSGMLREVATEGSDPNAEEMATKLPNYRYRSMDEWPLRLRDIFRKIVKFYHDGDTDLVESDLQYLYETLLGNFRIVTRNIHYDEILIRTMSQYPRLTENSMFFMAMCKYLQTLHEGVTTTLEKNQIFAAGVLIRVWIEAIATIEYVAKTEGAVESLHKDGILKDENGTKINVIELAKKAIPDIGSLYSHYSSFIHFDYKTLLQSFFIKNENTDKFIISYNLFHDWEDDYKRDYIQLKDDLYRVGNILLSHFVERRIREDKSHEFGDFQHPDYAGIYDLKYRELALKWYKEGIPDDWLKSAETPRGTE